MSQINIKFQNYLNLGNGMMYSIDDLVQRNSLDKVVWHIYIAYNSNRPTHSVIFHNEKICKSYKVLEISIYSCMYIIFSFQVSLGPKHIRDIQSKSPRGTFFEIWFSFFSERTTTKMIQGRKTDE